MNPNPGALTKFESQLLAYIAAHQPVSRQHLIDAWKMNTNTMSVHLTNLRVKGAVSNDGAGRYAKWTATAPQPKAAKPEPVVNIEQVSSIWHWAARHARAA